MNRVAILSLLTTLLGLVACASPDGAGPTIDGPLSPSFGVAAASLEAQALPPDANPAPPPSSGVRAAAAVARYDNGAVIQPAASPTSNVSSASANTSNTTTTTSANR